MYDLNDITERVREYLAVRHPRLDPNNVTVIRDLEGQDWMFLIQVRIPELSPTEIDREFDRYRVDIPLETKAWQGLGADHITVRSGKPLMIGDGDDLLAVSVSKDGLATIWLRDLS